MKGSRSSMWMRFSDWDSLFSPNNLLIRRSPLRLEKFRSSSKIYLVSLRRKMRKRKPKFNLLRILKRTWK